MKVRKLIKREIDYIWPIAVFVGVVALLEYLQEIGWPSL